MRVNGKITLDSGNFLGGVIPLLTACITVFDALRIYDVQRAARVAPLFLSGHANLIFVLPAQAGALPDAAGSRSASTSGPCATLDTLPATSAIGSRYVTGKAQQNTS